MNKRASIARDQLVQEGVAVFDAPLVAIDQPLRDDGDGTTPSFATTPGTRTSTWPGPVVGENGPDNSFLISSPSAAPSTASIEPWSTPKNVREFASQVNRVATMVLKGEVELERARVYSGLARTVAQAMSTEVSRARFLAQAPDLTFEEDDAPE